MLRTAENYAMSDAHKHLKIAQQYQAAVDRLVAAARWSRDKDEQALVDCWWDDYEEGHSLELLVTGMQISADQWSDTEMIGYDGVSENEVTDAKRIKFARELMLRDARDVEQATHFEAVKIKSSDKESAWAMFQVQILGQGGPSVDCFGIFRNMREFWKRFREAGWVDTGKITCAEDTKRWVTDKQILKQWSKT